MRNHIEPRVHVPYQQYGLCTYIMSLYGTDADIQSRHRARQMQLIPGITEALINHLKDFSSVKCVIEFREDLHYRGTQGFGRQGRFGLFLTIHDQECLVKQTDRNLNELVSRLTSIRGECVI